MNRVTAVSRMACFRSGSCLAVLLGAALLCRTVNADAPTVTPATEECLLPTNIARSARLNTRLSVLTKDTTTETAVVNAITGGSMAGGDKANCAVAQNVTPVSENVGGFMAKIPVANPYNCSAVVASIVTSGLSQLGSYPGTPWNNGTAAPYENTDVQNLMYMLYSPATGLGCGRTSNCTAGTGLLICRTVPALAAGYGQPVLTKGVYDALKERQAKGIDLTKLTAADLNTNLEGKQPSAAALLAIPGVLPVTALTLTSLLGFSSSVH